jgi:hypothetical protein
VQEGCGEGRTEGAGATLTLAEAGRRVRWPGVCAGSHCSQQWAWVEVSPCSCQHHLTLSVYRLCVSPLLQHNGGYISDNRMNFIFGTSERGSLERAFDALQAELDAMGVSDGLTRQQVGGVAARLNSGTYVCEAACRRGADRPASQPGGQVHGSGRPAMVVSCVDVTLLAGALKSCESSFLGGLSLTTSTAAACLPAAAPPAPVFLHNIPCRRTSLRGVTLTWSCWVTP